MKVMVEGNGCKKFGEVSQFVDCLFIPKKDEIDEIIFKNLKNGATIVNLKGYAIIPKDEYLKLERENKEKQL